MNNSYVIDRSKYIEVIQAIGKYRTYQVRLKVEAIGVITEKQIVFFNLRLHVKNKLEEGLK